MSTLTDAVEVRYSTKRIEALTNPDSPNATSKDDTRLQAAGTDTEARFKVEVGVTFDATDAAHLQAAMPGVIAHLLTYMGQGAGKKAMTAWIKDDLMPLRLITSRDRILPTTDSNLTPSVKPAVKPGFDSHAFYGLQLDNPADQEDSADGTF